MREELTRPDAAAGGVAVSLVLVAYRHAAGELRAAVDAVRDDVDEVLLVDNAGDEELDRVFADDAATRILRPGANLGYAPACNLAAQQARGAWLLFLNPDAVPEPGLVGHLLAAADEHAGVLGAQVLLPDGEHVNAGDNPLHLTGLSWAGRYGESVETGPAREVAVCSGAALLVGAADFAAIGGYHPGYFLYHDDVDLAWRMRLAGRAVRFVPAAHVRHDYVFDKGAYKWFWLERNRLWTILSNYDGRTLVALAPLLLAAEAGILLLAIRDGWWREKLRAWRALWRERGELRAWRRRVQATRRVGDRELLEAFTARLDTPLVAVPAPQLIGRLLEGYGAVVRLLARPSAR